MRFSDRAEAGEKLGAALARESLGGEVVVLGLPRGGVPVAAHVAAALRAPLDVMVVRKIGAPHQEELACGAIAQGGALVWNDRVLRALGLTKQDLAATVSVEEAEVQRRESAIRTAATPAVSLTGKTAIIVDDGIATGATMRAAIRAVKQASPRQIVVALPVGPEDTCRELEEHEGCRVVCLHRVEEGAFGSVGQWYDDFSQVETEECRVLLQRNRITTNIETRYD